MFYELKIQLVNLTKEKLSACTKNEGTPGERVPFSQGFIRWEIRKLKSINYFVKFTVLSQNRK